MPFESSYTLCTLTKNISKEYTQRHGEMTLYPLDEICANQSLANRSTQACGSGIIVTFQYSCTLFTPTQTHRKKSAISIHSATYQHVWCCCYRPATLARSPRTCSTPPHSPYHSTYTACHTWLSSEHTAFPRRANSARFSRARRHLKPWKLLKPPQFPGRHSAR